MQFKTILGKMNHVFNSEVMYYLIENWRLTWRNLLAHCTWYLKENKMLNKILTPIVILKYEKSWKKTSSVGGGT
jgi:hypothetical protein